MTVEEAKIAVDVGAKGIGVSNHGGRVLDYAPATAVVLPAIADAVKGKTTILVDGAVRRGQDVLKYLALGADVCLCGRPLVRGAHGGGREGVALMGQTDLSRCFGCGKDNPRGLHLVKRTEGNKAVIELLIEKDLCGFPGILHGSGRLAYSTRLFLRAATGLFDLTGEGGQGRRNRHANHILGERGGLRYDHQTKDRATRQHKQHHVEDRITQHLLPVLVGSPTTATGIGCDRRRPAGGSEAGRTFRHQKRAAANNHDKGHADALEGIDNTHVFASLSRARAVSSSPDQVSDFHIR